MTLARIVAIALVTLLGATSLSAHPHHHRALPSQEASTPAPGTITPGAKGVSGQGALRFRVVVTACKPYIITQAWNPGDFAVLEQVVP